jgi:ADP-heptose:LPS heptosyltransferase
LQLGALAAPPVLFRLPALPTTVQGAYQAAADLCEIRTLPWDHATPDRPFAPAEQFARVIDMRDFAFDPAFRGVAMIDFFLARLGLDPAQVPPALRRNAWLAPRLHLAPPPAGGYVLVCPRTSMRLRDMPAALHGALLHWLAAHAGRPVLTQGTPLAGTSAAPVAEDFAALCALVAGASLVISADTAMVHLADACTVPCLALFTTHRPEWRVRDYPLCRALHFPVPGLPEALEFARSPADEAAAQAAWPNLDALLPALEAMLVT